ncbi:PQQ-binding-like beta-propeller repeat protein [Mangrovibacterium marinum]|uniref:Outer membrane protein assembly factor BamB n=1 Tax=Mangrovibacterium marinum TaxID=1639118 RepID=A0A2T5C0Y0_9BACT|nr:PQQ-binding-like beta-propeller repeat protein [Mangrovibacterium marinum]PTN08229.1 outer membrane protein assembly factor BamB [Mangrovibacterium marinum]
MNEKRIIKAITYLSILVFAGAIVGWHLHSPRRDFEVLAPGADNRPEGLARNADDVKIGEFFMRYNEESSTRTGQWNSFRGENSTNIVTTPEKLNIGDSDFPVIWTVETGEGHASPVIYNGKVYFLDYDEKLSSDALRCFSLETGLELWRRWYRVPIKRNHGFSRTIPAIGDDYIVTIGPNGHVMCCDPNTGDLKWTVDMQKQYKSEIPFWYTGQCPLVDNHTLILAPAGDEVLLTALDCSTGEVLWTTPNTVNYKMSHSSVMKMKLNGKATYVYAGVGGICGISADQADAGKLLWDVNKWQPSVIAPSPVQVSRNQFFMVAGYGTGGAMIQVSQSGGTWTANVLDAYKPNAGIASEQQTPVFYNNMLICVMPKDGGALRNKLVCYSPNDLHTPLWSSAAEDRFRLGPYLIINDKLFALKDDGELYVYEIQKQALNLLKKQRIMDGVDAWGPMAYADGMLILRDAHSVKCIKIS